MGRALEHDAAAVLFPLGVPSVLAHSSLGPRECKQRTWDTRYCLCKHFN